MRTERENTARDKYDLIVRAHTQSVAKIMERIGKDGYTWRQTLLEGAKEFDYVTRSMIQEFIVDEQNHYNRVRQHLSLIHEIGMETI